VPHLIKALDRGQGWREVTAAEPGSVTPMKAENVAALHDGLWMVVNAAGTGGRARLEGYDVSGKTGTAQVISIQGRKAAGKDTEKDLRDHGWFVFFAPRDNPLIAGAIFAEHSEHGYLAAPIAKHVVNTYFAKREGRPLPEYPSPRTPPATVVASAPEAPSQSPAPGSGPVASRRPTGGPGE
jgi:penicillin-binding protein 2